MSTSIRRVPLFRQMFAVLIAAGSSACAGTIESDESDEPASQSTIEGLQLGDSGPEVERVNGYLSTYGYFPNAELARDFPDWQPIVLQGPAELALFDENTEQAVRAFQLRAGLPSTGVVDRDTQSMMDEPRCGVPDSAESGEDKWAHYSQRWADPAGLRYRVITGSTPEGRGATFAAMVDRAFAAWSARSGFRATRDDAGTPPITVGWAPLGSALGRTEFPGGSQFSTVDVYFNTNLSWTFDGESLNANDYHLASVILHEVGHALGLHHSNGGSSPVMFWSVPKNTNRTTFTIDDLNAVHVKEPGHTQIAKPDSGNSTQVVAGGDGSLWALGGNGDGNGFPMYKRNANGTWSEHPFGGRAVSMAVLEDGVVWHANAAGKLYRAGNGWVRKAGSGAMVAAAGNIAMHLGSAVVRGTRERNVYIWNGGSNNWDQVPGQIASDLALVKNPNENNRIEAWHINEAGSVYRQIIGQGLVRMPDVPGGACGISGGADGMVFVLQCPFNSTFKSIFVWNYQAIIFDRDTPGREGWVQMPGLARDITSTRESDPATNSRVFHIGSGGMYSSR